MNLSTCGILAEDILYLGVNGEAIEIVDNYDKMEGVHSKEGDSTGMSSMGMSSMEGGNSVGNPHSLEASEYVAIAEGESSKATLTLGLMMDSEETERGNPFDNRTDQQCGGLSAGERDIRRGNFLCGLPFCGEIQDGDQHPQ